VPAALENQIGVDEAKALDVRLVAEGANGPCTPEGEKILLERGIEIIPDVLANSGGVTVSYYEWVQNKRSERSTGALEEVDVARAKKLEKAMRARSTARSSPESDDGARDNRSARFCASPPTPCRARRDAHRAPSVYESSARSSPERGARRPSVALG
jgi:glutamate dehydrogenase/leucine dehydrogenase